MNTNRVTEIIETMKSFEKERYHKNELLKEMFDLQAEMVNLTFNDAHSSQANLKIWDVEKYFEELNSECGHIADNELAKFESESKMFCNLIKAEISGNRGESKAFRSLDYIQIPNKVLRNVELGDEFNRTELDAVVVTSRSITIVEVKNTARDVYINESGNYYRTGEFLKWDSNIGEKMLIKERLLRDVLASNGYGDVTIKSVVVFTNNRIQVQNKYAPITTCFISQLNYIIERNHENLDDEIFDIQVVENAILNAATTEAYAFDFDVAQYKYDFAILMAKLESAKKGKQVEFEEEENKPMFSNKNGWDKVIPTLKQVFTPKRLKFIGGVAAAVVLVATSGTVSSNTIGKGGF